MPPFTPADDARAAALDRDDPLRPFRDEFLFPKTDDGRDRIYLTGNSLGLQPKTARAYVEEVMTDWATLAVEGHFRAKHAWMPYHEHLTASTARLVGALPVEVVVMNTLTVNLHLMMVSFYRPTRERHKVIMEAGAFPSDQYAVASQVKFHGFAPAMSIVELKPRDGEALLRMEDVVDTIGRHGAETALVMVGNCNYLTGQAYDVRAITRAAHAAGARVGFDLAHGAGNLTLNLHDDGPDFAVWCSYKYLNGGPGTLAGAFVHERHAKDPTLPRFAGWWGHDKATRFRMGPDFQPIVGAEGWQLSNAPILQLSTIRAAMEQFDRAGLDRVRAKRDALTGHLFDLLSRLPAGWGEIVTPADPTQRGSQLSLRVRGDAKGLQKRLYDAGVVSDFREPDVVRAAPTPLYNSFTDVLRFARILGDLAA